MLVLILAYALYIERVAAAEEHFLARTFGPEYDAWALIHKPTSGSGAPR